MSVCIAPLLSLLVQPAFAQDLGVTGLDASAEAASYRRPPPPPPLRRPPPPPRRPAPRPVKTAAELEKDVTLSLSPLHLAMGMVALNGEFRASDDVSLMLGGSLGADNAGTLYDVNAQLRGYALGDFDRGLNLGLEARYGNADLFWVHGPAWALGPVAGLKYTFDGGFVVEAQVGAEFVNGDGFIALAPTANLNLGFSF